MYSFCKSVPMFDSMFQLARCFAASCSWQSPIQSLPCPTQCVVHTLCAQSTHNTKHSTHLAQSTAADASMYHPMFYIPNYISAVYLQMLPALQMPGAPAAPIAALRSRVYVTIFNLLATALLSKLRLFVFTRRKDLLFA